MQQVTTRVRDRLGGPLSPVLVLGLLCPLTVLCFAVALGLAAAAYPASFDVRHQWISSLASAKRNPMGYFYMGAGFAAVAALLIPLRSYMASGPHASPVARSAGATLLLIGITALLLLGVETTAFPNYGRNRPIHRLLSLVTLSSLTLGFVTLTVSRVRRMPGNWGPACLACAVLLAPAVGSALSALWLHLGEAPSGWAISRQAKQAAPFFRTLSFWEWAAVTGLFAGGYLSAWAVTPRRAPVPATAVPRSVPDAAGRSPTHG